MAECPPFWQAFVKTTEVDLCPPGTVVTTFDHPTPLQYDWGATRNATLESLYTANTGGSIVDGYLVTDFGAEGVFDYNDAEGGFNLRMYVALHEINTSVSGADAGPYLIEVTYTRASGDISFPAVAVRAPVSGDLNGQGIQDEDLTFDANELTAVLNFILSDTEPKLMQTVAQTGIHGDTVGQVRIKCVDDNGAIRPGVRVAIIAAQTTTPS